MKKIHLIVLAFFALLLGGCATNSEVYRAEERIAYYEAGIQACLDAKYSPNGQFSSWRLFDCAENNKRLQELAPSTPPATQLISITCDVACLYDETGAFRDEEGNIMNCLNTSSFCHYENGTEYKPASENATVQYDEVRVPPMRVVDTTGYYWHGEYCLKNETRYVVENECEDCAHVRNFNCSCLFLREVPRLVHPDNCPPDHCWDVPCPEGLTFCQECIFSLRMIE